MKQALLLAFSIFFITAGIYSFVESMETPISWILLAYFNTLFFGCYIFIKFLNKYIK